MSADSDDLTHTRPLRHFDSRLVYSKTNRGSSEMVERALDLSSGARRMLIVIDGQRRLGDLPAFARPGELGAMIQELESNGLIALAGIADEMPDTERRARIRLEGLVLAELKQQLAGMFVAQLGTSAGEVLEARLADALNVEIAKRVLRDGVDVMTSRLGEQSARAVIQAAKPVLAKLG